MPQKFLEADLSNMGKIDLVGDGELTKFVESLARKYEVSNQSLLIRLTNLGVLSSKF